MKARVSVREARCWDISTFRELSKGGIVRKEEPEAGRALDSGGAFAAISQKSGLTLAPLEEIQDPRPDPKLLS